MDRSWLLSKIGRSRSRSRATALACAALSLGLLFHRSFRIDYAYSNDFQVYWLSGKRVASGAAGDLYAAGGGTQEGIPLELPRNEFKNAPLVAAAFAPLSGMDYLEAKRVFWWIGLLSIAGSALLLGIHVVPERVGDRLTRAAWALAVLAAFAPAHIALRHGQTTPLVLLALVGSLALAARGDRAFAGVLLGLGGLVKLPVLLLAGVEVLHRRWRTLAGFAATLVAAGTLSLLVFGGELHRQYLEGIRLHAGAVMTGHNNQSLAAVTTRLSSAPAPAFDWEPRPMSRQASAATLSSGLVLLGLLSSGLSAAWRGTRAGAFDRERYLLAWTAVLALALVILPVSWDHYFLLLAPGLFVLWRGLGRRRPRDGLMTALLVGAALALALPTPDRVLERAGELGLPGALLISHFFFGAIAVLAASVMGMRSAPPMDPVSGLQLSVPSRRIAAERAGAVPGDVEGW